jgi:DNA-binding LacI/PurR family transcriptional regulator
MKPSDPNARITLRDVAQRLGVSHSTVSRALRSDPQISAAVRQRVQETAREMGHRPDPLLSALTLYRQGKVKKGISAELAWLNHWPDPKQLRSHREFDLYWKGASDEAARCGYRLEEFRLDAQVNWQKLERILRARNIRGILLPPKGHVDPDYGGFRWDDFCVVRFGHSIPFPHAHLVTSDQLTDGVIAFQNIWEKGYRRVGLVTSANARIVTRFSAGFLYGQAKWSPRVRIPALVLSEDCSENDRRQLDSWLKRHRPDAILTDLRQLRFLLKQAGCKVPGDLGLAALSVLDGDADAGIDQNSEEIGKVAVQLVISLINHNECGIPQICREVLIEGRWVDGTTMPPRR